MPVPAATFGASRGEVASGVWNSRDPQQHAALATTEGGCWLLAVTNAGPRSSTPEAGSRCPVTIGRICFGIGADEANPSHLARLAKSGSADERACLICMIIRRLAY